MEYQKKLIEGNFPCQQVGAETKRERGASSSLPPLYFLHVWWARRPLTPSRAAVLGSILPADTAPEDFLKELGIVKKQVAIGDQRWTLVGKNLMLIESDEDGEYIPYSIAFQTAFDKENERRAAVSARLRRICEAEQSFTDDPLVKEWLEENAPLALSALANHRFSVISVSANPALVNQRIAFAESERVVEILGKPIQIDAEDLYAYGRAYESPVETDFSRFTVLDPTAGGGSIPFEAMRLGCKVIANDLNPVASAIEMATLQYPQLYGTELIRDIEAYGEKLEKTVSEKMAPFYFFAKPQGEERQTLLKQCGGSQTLFETYDVPEMDQQGILFYREVTCPNCGERAPLLNAFALSKKKDGWMVIPKIEGAVGSKKVRFVPVRLKNGRGPHGEDPEKGTVRLGTGSCIHCGQAIESDEIKRQARGESRYGAWSDRLYCVVGIREQPKLDKNGKVMRYASGPNKGKVRTEKVTFFREPVQEDFDALERAEQALKENWDHWEELDLIPTERIPDGHKTAEPLRVGINRWCDLTAMETLHDMIPDLLREHGKEKGTAIAHYLQYMIDKGIDYNSKQTRWHYSRGAIIGSFGRHDFSLKWSFGEMIYTGESAGLKWGMDQILDAYKGLCATYGLLRFVCIGNPAVEV